jgi:lipoate-protein ligase A
MAEWLVLDSGKCPPAFNMALDESLLEAMPRLQQPVLRFYGWTEPAASFGYFQKYAEVERATMLRPLVRRPTAGGIVPHDADWTYSLAFPTTHEWYGLRAEDSYRRAHEWVQEGLARVGFKTELAMEAKKSAQGQCFVGYEKFDVLRHGKKVAGAAQRRNKQGLLIQGSVQPPVAINRYLWENIMFFIANRNGGARFAEPMDELVAERAQQLAAEKYSTAAYNQKR